MDTQPGDKSKIDEFVTEVLCEPMPEATERQLRQRIEEVRMNLSNRKQHLLSRRRVGWLAVAATGIAAAIVVPLFLSSVPPVWGDVVARAKERPWIHFSAKHPNGTRLQFWVSIRKGIDAMKAGDAEFAHFQSKETRTRHSYRASEGVLYQQPYRRPPGELSCLETLFDAFSSGAKTVEVPGPDKILAQSRREVVRAGQQLWEYEFTLRALDQGHADTYIVVFQVNPETRLPQRWVRKSLDGGGEMSFDVDYPREGPQSIFDLGVPRTAKLVVRKQ